MDENLLSIIASLVSIGAIILVIYIMIWFVKKRNPIPMEISLERDNNSEESRNI